MITPVQTQILHHYSRGLQAKEIARLMKLSHRTVENQMGYVRERLGARTSVHAVGIALGVGLITFPAEEAAKTIAARPEYA